MTRETGHNLIYVEELYSQSAKAGWNCAGHFQRCLLWEPNEDAFVCYCKCKEPTQRQKSCGGCVRGGERGRQCSGTDELKTTGKASA